MKHIVTLCTLAVALTITPTRETHAALVNGCFWDPNGVPGPVGIEFSIPDELQVAQDAPVGTLVGGREFSGWGTVNPRAAYECMNNPQGGNPVDVDFHAVNTQPISLLSSGLPKVPMTVPEESIIQTSIPGLGVSIRMAHHVDGTSEANGEFIVQKAEARVPFLSTRHYMHPTILRIAAHEYFVSLIKTGPIPAGRHTFDPGTEVMHAYLTQPVSGGTTTTLNFHLAGTLVSSGCGTAADPVTPNPVELGEFEAKDFDQAGAATQSVRFEFNLENCQSSGGGNLPRVHLQLDPTNGSTAIDAPDGRFSTGAGSTASGVAFQLLKEDGIQPMPLSAKVPLSTVPSGDTKLPLHVRLVKHTGPVTSGTLAGALSFTLTYE